MFLVRLTGQGHAYFGKHEERVEEGSYTAGGNVATALHASGCAGARILSRALSFCPMVDVVRFLPFNLHSWCWKLLLMVLERCCLELLKLRWI